MWAGIHNIISATAFAAWLQLRLAKRTAKNSSSRRAEIQKGREKQSKAFGIWSLISSIIGIFLWVGGIVAIVLGALQFRRHISKCSIAGFTLGIVDVVLSLVGIGLTTWLG